MNRLFALAIPALMLPIHPAGAEEGENIRVRVGLGGQIRPEYIGADKNAWAPLWDLAIARGTDPFDFEAPDDSFDIKLYSKHGFSLGPVANIEGSRKRSEVDVPVDKVPTTVEVGAFAQYDVSETVRLRTELRKGVGGHKGIIASLGADRVWRDGDNYVFSIGPRLLLSDGRYQRAWFGVSPETSIATGLPAYRPGGGLHAIGAASGATYQFSPRWGLFGYARYDRLVGKAAKSPIIRDLGSKDQMSAGGGLTYTFTIKQ